jgi:hypothetical protein
MTLGSSAGHRSPLDHTTELKTLERLDHGDNRKAEQVLLPGAEKSNRRAKHQPEAHTVQMALDSCTTRAMQTGLVDRHQCLDPSRPHPGFSAASNACGVMVPLQGGRRCTGPAVTIRMVLST